MRRVLQGFRGWIRWGKRGISLLAPVFRIFSIPFGFGRRDSFFA